MSEPSCCPLCGASLSPEQMECTACGETIPRQEAPRRFRWRFIPTALLTLFGGTGVLCGVLILVMCSVMAAIYPQYRRPFIVEPLGIGMASLTWGTLWLFGAHWCWQRRWVRFTLAFVAGYAVIGIASQFFPR